MTTDSPDTPPTPPLFARAARAFQLTARLLYIAIAVILLVRPSTLFPVGGEQCSFCFREATGTVTYRGTKSGEIMPISVCDSHRASAPKSGRALDFGYFKLIAWIVMLGPFAFAFVTLGRTLFLNREPPAKDFGPGCITFVLIPMLAGQLVYLAGFRITGRVIEWLSVFLMLTAAMAIVTAPFMPNTQPKAPEAKA